MTSVSTMFSTYDYDYILIVQIVLKTIYIDSIYMHILIYTVFSYTVCTILYNMYCIIFLFAYPHLLHMFICVFLICSLMIVYHVKFVDHH